MCVVLMFRSRLSLLSNSHRVLCAIKSNLTKVHRSSMNNKKGRVSEIILTANLKKKSKKNC